MMTSLPMRLDPNLAANARYALDTSPDKVNLAIGTNIGSNGRPWSLAVTYPSVIGALVQTTGDNCGAYTQVPKDKLEIVARTLRNMCGIPQNTSERCVVSWAAGGGTGALNRAVSLLRLNGSSNLIVQEDGWPGYSALARAHRLHTKKIPIDLGGDLDVFSEYDDIPIIQLVHNGTGKLTDVDHWKTIMTEFARRNIPVILDVPYLGFDACDRSYREALAISSIPINASIESGVLLTIAFSPTKVFNTFAYRPGGATIVVCRNTKEVQSIENQLKVVERGSSGFLDVATHALINALVEKKDGLCADHELILQRLAQAQSDWKQNSERTPLGTFFSAEYGGLFRIIPVREGALQRLAHRHIHAVDATETKQQRIRINVMGIPHDRARDIVETILEEMM